MAKNDIVRHAAKHQLIVRTTITRGDFGVHAADGRVTNTVYSNIGSFKLWALFNGDRRARKEESSIRLLAANPKEINTIRALTLDALPDGKDVVSQLPAVVRDLADIYFESERGCAPADHHIRLKRSQDGTVAQSPWAPLNNTYAQEAADSLI